MSRRKMSAGLQSFSIGRMLAGTKWNNELFDISANLDRTLTYGENAANIRKQLGIQTRNKGLEAIEQREREKKQARKLRSDPLRQTGPVQGAYGFLMDKHLQAMRPGRRHSRSGSRYYERRENRSDRGKYL